MILNFSFIFIEEKIYYKIDRYDLYSKYFIYVNYIVLVKNINFNNKMFFFSYVGYEGGDVLE